MLVKVNGIDITNKKVKVTQLDIDDYGSVIPIKKLELKIPSHDNESVIQTLKSSSYAAIFTEGNIDDNDSSRPEYQLPIIFVLFVIFAECRL